MLRVLRIATNSTHIYIAISYFLLRAEFQYTVQSMSVVETVTEVSQTLNLRGKDEEQKAELYPYAHLLPHFSPEKFPPLTPFKHEDPAFRALQHADPRAFLKNAISVVELTPDLGTEVQGVNLATLDSDGRDQLALEVGLVSVI